MENNFAAYFVNIKSLYDHGKPAAWAAAFGFVKPKPEPWAVTSLSDGLWWPQLPTAQLGRLQALSLSRQITNLHPTPQLQPTLQLHPTPHSQVTP